MDHSKESLLVECGRILRRPEVEEVPPYLGEFTVEVTGEVEEYVARLRSLLSSAVELGATNDFEDDEVPVDDVPGWFLSVSKGGSGDIPEFARLGSDEFQRLPGSGVWSAQNWLFRFDPEDDSRGWEWWDLTRSGPSRVAVWVDCQAEDFFGCQELRWALYVAGGSKVDGPNLRRSDAWRTSVSHDSGQA
ncbi:hypothetical protein [Streptantibioticus silvisoli]|uniref:Uncharacterized protein n=1 Tax=Streptantibioticus silvisoli TaxID=2705255 RepID=A0ABT6W119_9ACTN|nr:hypothetical protein [Streptantibioticus silvisoli]MDI5964441.1 hypothetical protein [Streptantibioticus silvisoli]